MREIKQASIEVLKIGKYRILTTAVALVMLALYVLLPVVTIPGNDLQTQIAFTSPMGFVVMLLLSASIGLLISMQVYSYRVAKANAVSNVAQGAATGFSSVIGAVFGTASCTWCIAAIFPFLGSGAILFLAQQQWYIVGITFALVLFSLYITSKKVVNGCKSCKVRA